MVLRNTAKALDDVSDAASSGFVDACCSAASCSPWSMSEIS